MKTLSILALILASVSAFGLQESSTNTYDAAGRLTQIVTTATGMSVKLYFAYDRAGNLVFESRYAPGSENADFDADGMQDAVEFTDFGTLTQGAQDDYDGDRFANVDEYRAGTSATNASSYLGVESSVRNPSGSGFVIRWQSVDGRRYTLGRASNLVNGGFASVKTNIMGVAPMNTETDATAIGSGPWIYRINME